MSITEILFYAFSAVLVVAAVGVITARNPVHAVLFLVFAFFNSAVIWLLLEAEFLAIVLMLVYVGAVMVLFLFVVMMLDINVAQLREGFTRYAPLGTLIAALVVIEIGSVVWVKQLGTASRAAVTATAPDYSNTRALGELLYTKYLYPFEIAAMLLLLAIVAAIVLTMRRRTGLKAQDIAGQVAVRARDRVRIGAAGDSAMIPLSSVLMLGGLLFALSVAGIFLNRRNVILLLMCIELMLLAVNFNFVGFARHLGDLNGQVFVFFIMTVAAAESAIGLAILVVLFRERRNINTDQLDTMKG
jgi:NADH-quinone oxidoreductase subunit J